jgi:hypothetical protein
MLIYDSPAITTNPEILDLTEQSGPMTIALNVPGSTTAKVELSYDNKRSWFDWVPGTVSAFTLAQFADGEVPTHIKASRVTGSGIVYMTATK